jgi:hypothetical protein
MSNRERVIDLVIRTKEALDPSAAGEEDPVEEATRLLKGMDVKFILMPIAIRDLEKSAARIAKLMLFPPNVSARI